MNSGDTCTNYKGGYQFTILELFLIFGFSVMTLVALILMLCCSNAKRKQILDSALDEINTLKKNLAKSKMKIAELKSANLGTFKFSTQQRKEIEELIAEEVKYSLELRVKKSRKERGASEESLQDEHMEMLKKLVNALKKLERLYNNNMDLCEKNKEYEKQIRNLEGKLIAMDKSLEKLKPQVESNKARKKEIATLKKDVERLREKLSEANLRISNFEKDREKGEVVEFMELEKEVRKLKADVEEKKSELGKMASLKKEYEDQQRKLKKFQHNKGVLDHEVKTLKSRLKTSDERRGFLEKELTRKNSEIQEMVKAQDAASTGVGDIRSSTQSRADIERLEYDLGSRKELCHKLEKEKKDVEARCSELEKENQRLIGVVQSYKSEVVTVLKKKEDTESSEEKAKKSDFTKDYAQEIENLEGLINDIINQSLHVLGQTKEVSEKEKDSLTKKLEDVKMKSESLTRWYQERNVVFIPADSALQADHDRLSVLYKELEETYDGLKRRHDRHMNVCSSVVEVEEVGLNLDGDDNLLGAVGGSDRGREL